MRRKPHPYYDIRMDKVKLVSNTRIYLDVNALLDEILENVFAMATINREVSRPVATLRTDEINMNLLYLLESRYIVIVSQQNNDIVLELYNK